MNIHLSALCNLYCLNCPTTCHLRHQSLPPYPLIIHIPMSANKHTLRRQVVNNRPHNRLQRRLAVNPAALGREPAHRILLRYAARAQPPDPALAMPRLQALRLLGDAAQHLAKTVGRQPHQQARAAAVLAVARRDPQAQLLEALVAAVWPGEEEDGVAVFVRGARVLIHSSHDDCEERACLMCWALWGDDCGVDEMLNRCVMVNAIRIYICRRNRKRYNEILTECLESLYCCAPVSSRRYPKRKRLHLLTHHVEVTPHLQVCLKIRCDGCDEIR